MIDVFMWSEQHNRKCYSQVGVNETSEGQDPSLAVNESSYMMVLIASKSYKIMFLLVVLLTLLVIDEVIMNFCHRKNLSIRHL